MVNIMNRSCLYLAVAILLTASCLAGTPPATQPTSRLNLLIPAYIYPGGAGLKYWDQLATAARTVSLTVILNINNGPGTESQPIFVAVTNKVRNNGGNVVGYVYTKYGKRSLETVQADVALYTTLNYNINGIFIDEMANEPTPANLKYYAALYNYIKKAHPDWRVFGNPGVSTAQAFIDGTLGRTADTFIVYEDKQANYAADTAKPWNAKFARANFGHVIYAAADAATMSADIVRAIALNAGYVFVTDAKLPNPYNILPVYWPAEVSKVQQATVP